jgi:hypothetical protein
MASFVRAALLAAACMLALLAPASARSQDSGNLTGRWVLNRNQSQVDKEVGFNPDWLIAGVRTAQGESGGSGGGRGRRGSGGGQQGGFAAPRESEEDARRVQQLSAEARMPSPHLTIMDTRGTVTITDADDVSRTLHTDGNDDYLQVHGLPITAVTVRDSGHVVVRYRVEQGRELRYTYTREAAGPKLTVDIQFVERGSVGDTVRRVYDLIGPDDPFPTTPDLRSKTDPGANAAVPAVPPTAGLRGAAPAAASGAAPPEPSNQQPDAELKGLTRLGIVIEALGAQAASCGLTEAALEAAVAGKLKSAGFTVLTNTDEDSYVYVNVITGSLSTGSCVSRFDVTVYTHTTARLTYQPSPVLVQVSLLHKGGISGAAAAGHAATVVKGVSEYLDEFITRIKAANM